MTKGQRIKELREKSGMSQVALADRINVTKQSMYKYENDIITNIPSDKIEAIARECNSTPEYIMGWDSKEEEDQMLELLKNDLLKKLLLAGGRASDEAVQFAIMALEAAAKKCEENK